MERDRQGPDPRYATASHINTCYTPPPLDVYQLIWDRTCMIHKDFLLQNYTVGGKLTHGKNSVCVVRYQERIARWHLLS
jgi:hypothetical protein